MNKIFFNLILLFFLLMSTMALGQKDIADQSYNLDFLEAKYNENKGEKEILLIFKYEPKKKKKFKPILSTKITYSIGDDEIEKNEYMMMSKHSIVFYGNDIDEKSPEVYRLI